ncbi:MAG: minor capsid protein [Gloeomargaritales cyanobacterium]
MTTIVEALGLRFADLGFGVYKESGQYESYETGIFLDYMAETPPNCIVITTATGEPADSLQPYDELRVQIRVRAESPITGRLLAQQIYDDIHGLGPLDVHGAYLGLSICVESGPVYDGRDENKLQHYHVYADMSVKNPNRRGMS